MALKVPSYGARSSDEHGRLRAFIQKEARILAEVRCPALPKLLYTDTEYCFLVREFISGERLGEYLNVGLAQKADLLTRLLRTGSMVFRSFHQSNGGHVLRDFKANNLIVTGRDNHMKLIDVDSTRPESNMLSENPNADWVGSGKWLHWSPEQLLEIKDGLDHRTDYFALGVTAYELLIGTKPYSNRTRRRELVLQAYLSEYQVAVDRLQRITLPSVRKELFDFLLHCLHPDPNKRASTFWIDPFV
jgi:serine/threonine protein kinase